MRIAVLALALLPLAAGVAIAQGDPIKERRQLMKQIGDQTGIGAAMLKGQQPFDAAKAALIFKTFAEDGEKFGKLFPEGSGKGETKATPAVWTDRAKFDAALASFVAASKDAVPKATTEASFKTAFAAVTEGCRTCHQSFRSR